MVSLPTVTFSVVFLVLLMLATFLLPGPLVEARSVNQLSPAETARTVRRPEDSKGERLSTDRPIQA